MSQSHEVSAASLRILVAVAKADGKLDDAEREALQSAIESGNLLEGPSVDELFATHVNVGVQMGIISDPGARQACYNSAVTLAYADGDCSSEEQAILDELKAGWGVQDKDATFVGRMLSEAKDTVLPSGIAKITDPVRRQKEISQDTLKYAILSGVLGAFPVPGVSIALDIAVIGMQAKLVRDIGQYYGHKLDGATAKSLLGAVGVGTGARIAVSNLAKLIPGFGSAVGATTSFAATYGIGKMAVAYFDNDCKLDLDMLKKTFSTGQKAGKDEYKAKRDEIDRKQKEHQAKIEQLANDRKAGKISDEAYQAELDRLA